MQEAQALAGDRVLTQDTDVLDTWFSSGIWPTGTLGWPAKTEELERYYPTSVFTGFDIIFFWVARMIMMQMETVKNVPFKKVYVHALVRDEKGKKMSKSTGNVLDPLVLIDKYGADALRFTLTAMAVTGRDLKLSEPRIQGYRNFVTKIWNAARFLELNKCTPCKKFNPESVKEPANIWIINETKQTLKEINKSFKNFRFNDVANLLYNHTWKVFCDWYVEFSKALLDSDDRSIVKETKHSISWAFDQCLLMLHPIMPFVTEELWSQSYLNRELLTTSSWPALDNLKVDSTKVKKINWVISVIESIRSTKADFNLLGGNKTDLLIASDNEELYSDLNEHKDLVCRLSRISEIKFVEKRPSNTIVVSGNSLEAFIPISDDFNVGLEKARIEKSLEKFNSENNKLSIKLDNDDFLHKAPPEVIKKFRDEQEALVIQIKKLDRLLDNIDGLI
jgi:valyl-tRNA synthetase